MPASELRRVSAGGASSQVRRPLLTGHQPVGGLWFPAPAGGRFDAVNARRWIALWQPGTRAWRFAEGDFLQFPEVREQLCESLPGWPLRREGTVWSSAPLDERERGELPQADLWIVRGGDVLALHLRDAEPLDPAPWLDLRAVALHDLHDLHIPVPEPVLLDPEARPLREVLGPAVPAASQERAALMKAFARRRDAMAARPSETASAPRREGIAWRIVLVVVLLFLSSGLKVLMDDGNWLYLVVILALCAGVALLVNFWRRASQSWRSGEHQWTAPSPLPGASGTAAPASEARARPAARSVPGIIARRLGRVAPERWRHWLARLAVTSQASRWLGRRQSAHLRRMLQLFDDGDLGEALRHALPLGGEGGSLGQAFGAPKRRDTLDLGPRSTAAGPSIHIDGDLQEHLRRTYRQAFERLEREKRIDEAVFVLAELLQSHQEALDLLEKHGRYAQAAELALAWDRPADVIVRLHCLAGDWRRAVAVARRDGAFANAVTQLQTRWPDAARRLRDEWGRTLAERGDWLGAVQAVWPDAQLRGAAAAWLLKAESAEGELGARALALRSLLLPDTLERCRDRLLDLCADPVHSDERVAMALILVSAPEQTPQSSALAAALLPVLFADRAQGQSRLPGESLQRLLALSRDPLLQADLPSPWPQTQAVPLQQRTVPLELAVPERGLHELLDVVWLDEQRLLVALGEAGVGLVDVRTGRLRMRFDAPAQRLVSSPFGQQALALSRRGELWRVSRIDLVQREVTDLGMARFDHFADAYDGVAWTVAHGRRLLVLDTARSLHEVLWQVPDLPAPVRDLVVSPRAETLRVGEEVWRYSLPQRRLVARDPEPVGAQAVGEALCLHPDRGPVRVQFNPAPLNPQLQWHWPGLRPQSVDLPVGQQPVHVYARGDWLLQVTNGGVGTPCQLHWISVSAGRVCATLAWPGPHAPRVRHGESGGWLVFDGEGRLLRLDTELGSATGLSVC